MINRTQDKRFPSKLWKCVCGECDPDVLNLALNNCGMCGYLALSSPIEDDGDRTYEHRCPQCGDSWWLTHETWSRGRGFWVSR
jgi:hypothetical protein